MSSVLVGINHKTAPVSVREHVALNEERVRAALLHLKEYTVIDEVVVLSTCNRTEIYVVTESPQHAEIALCEYLREYFKGMADPSGFFYRKQDKAVWLHLCEVASSLDSQVVGESQIMGQVRTAYQLALEAQCVRSESKRLFETALFIANRVRKETEIGKGSVSIGSVGIQLAQNVLGDLSDRRIVLLGAGEVGKLVVKYLNSHKIKKTFIVNRTFERAQMLEEQGLGKACRFEDLEMLVTGCDILVTSVEGQLEELSVHKLESIMKERQECF